MKRKIIAISLFLIFAIIAHAKETFAYSAIFTPPDADIDDLDHWKYYTWGIFSAIPPGEQILGATLYIDNINNWNQEENILYIHLLDTDFAGLTFGWDNQVGGDAFAGQGILLATYQDTKGKPGPAEDLIYPFTAEQLASLNSYAQDNQFGFGFDPDCHFYNDGVYFELTTIPEPASLSLLSLGLLGLLGFKKRRIRRGHSSHGLLLRHNIKNLR